MTKLAFSPRDPGHLKPIIDVGNPLYYIQRAIESLNVAKGMFGKSGCRYEDEMHTAIRLIMLATLYTEGWDDDTKKITEWAKSFLGKIKGGDVINADAGVLQVFTKEQIENIQHNAVQEYKIQQMNEKMELKHEVTDVEISPDGNGSGVGCSQPGIGHTGAV